MPTHVRVRYHGDSIAVPGGPTVVQPAAVTGSAAVLRPTPVIAEGGEVTLAVISDTQFSVAEGWAANLVAMKNRIVAVNPTYLIHCGDTTDNGIADEYALWDQHMSDWKGRMVPCPGNHDGKTNGLGAWWSYFSTGVYKIGASQSAPYTSFDLNGWHIICLSVLSPTSLMPINSSSAQYHWLQDDIAANANGNNYPICAFWHMPRYACDDTHNDSTVVEPIATLLYNAGAKFVANGHVHRSTRFPQADFGGTLRTPGTREFVCSGANNRDAFRASASGLTPDFDDHADADIALLVFTLTPTTWSWNFVRVSDGQSLDSGGPIAV